MRHHGDDPEAIRVALGIDNNVSHHRESLDKVVDGMLKDMSPSHSGG